MKENMQNTVILSVKAAFGIIDEKPLINENDMLELLKVATRQSILYIVIRGVEKLGYGNLLPEDVQKHVAKAAYDYVQRRESINRLSQVLTDAEVAHMPLKGAVLRELYPDPCMRSSSDIDVLVQERDIEKAIKCIQDNTSFRFERKAHHDVHLLNEKLHLELHYSLLSNISRMDSVLQKAWTYANPIGDGYCYVFVPEYQLFYITAHAAKHFIKQGGVGIRPLLDLWLLKTRTVFDEIQVAKLCEEAGILGFYDMCCSLLEVWFGNKSHTAETKDFSELAFSGGVFGSNHTKNVAQVRKNRGARYVFRRVFKSGKDIKELYPICEKRPLLIPVYQVVRWTHLLNPATRKTIRTEYREVRSLNSDEVAKYDRLLKKMGL